MQKKIVSLLLALILAAGVLPFGTVFAEPAVIEHPEVEPACDTFGTKAYYELNGELYKDPDCTEKIDDLYEWKWDKTESGGLIWYLGHLGVPTEDKTLGHYCQREGCDDVGDLLNHTFNEDCTACDECGVPCAKGVFEDPTYSDFYAFYNEFKTDGSELKYIWYYIDSDITLDYPLIIAGKDVRLLLADNVCLDAALGYYVKEGAALEIWYQSRGANKGKFKGTLCECYDESENAAYFEHFDNDSDDLCDHCGKDLLPEAKTVAKNAIDAAAGNAQSGPVAALVNTAKTLIDEASSSAAANAIVAEYADSIRTLAGTTSHEHIFSDKWKCNEQTHWHASLCGHPDVVSGFGSHTFNSGVRIADSTVYTCTVCGYRRSVRAAIVDVESEPVQENVKFKGVSLTLADDINMNFYMQLTENAAQNGTMTFTVGDESFISGLHQDPNGYFFTCPVTVLEMATEVTATFSYGGVDYVKTYSVKDYVTEIIERDFPAEMKTLAKKLANYGYYTQNYLESIHTNVTIDRDESGEGYPEMLRYADCDLSVADVSLTDGFTAPADTENLAFDGRTVYFESATALNYYVVVSDGTAPTAICAEGKEVEVKLYKGKTYVVSVKNITATELDTKFTVTVNGAYELKSSVLDYCAAVMNAHSGKTDQKDVAAVNAMAAFYEYHAAALAFVSGK